MEDFDEVARQRAASEDDGNEDDSGMDSKSEDDVSEGNESEVDETFLIEDARQYNSMQRPTGDGLDEDEADMDSQGSGNESAIEQDDGESEGSESEDNVPIEDDLRTEDESEEDENDPAQLGGIFGPRPYRARDSILKSPPSASDRGTVFNSEVSDHTYNYFGTLTKSEAKLKFKEKTKVELRCLPDQTWTNICRCLRKLMNRGRARFARDSTRRSKVFITGPIPHFKKESEDLPFGYQREGAGWCVDSMKQLGGSLLADQMGLGKTIQSLTIIAILSPDKTLTRPSLVVVPANALSTWKRDIARTGLFEAFATEDQPAVLYWDDTQKIKNDCRKLSPEILSKYKLVVILQSELQQLHKLLAESAASHMMLRDGYTLVRNDRGITEPIRPKRAPCSIFQVEWNVIVVDEAHTMRNSNGCYRAACKLIGAHRLAITGTFIVNSEDDLDPMLNFLRIKPFIQYEGLYRFCFSSEGDTLTRSACDKISMIVQAFTTRRFQGEIFESKVITDTRWMQEQSRQLTLTPGEQKLQEATRSLWEGNTGEEAKTRKKAKKEDDDADPEAEHDEKKRNSYAEMTKAQLALIHPLAATWRSHENQGRRGPNLNALDAILGEDEAGMRVNSALVRLDYDRLGLREAVPSFNNDGVSSYKSTIILATLEILKKEELKHGAIVHCMYLKGLDILRVGIEAELPGVPMYEYIGALSKTHRESAERAFNEDCKAGKRPILLMTAAGATGLNFPHAAGIVHMTSGWSDAIEQQVSSRLKRLDRETMFIVYHLRVKDSISRRQDVIRDKKRLLSEAIVVQKDDIKHLRIAVLRQQDPISYMHMDNIHLWNLFEDVEEDLDTQIACRMEDTQAILELSDEDFMIQFRGTAPAWSQETLHHEDAERDQPEMATSTKRTRHAMAEA